jgi:hypothetical protein
LVFPEEFAKAAQDPEKPLDKEEGFVLQYK